MGKKLEISAYTTASVGFPVKEGTWDFLQLAYQERFAATIIALIGSAYSTLAVYVLYGLYQTPHLGNTDFASGAVFYNGDVYLYAGQLAVTNPAGANVFVLNLLKTQYSTNADPVAFIGGSSENVHNIYTATIGTGLTGTGTLTSTIESDFSNLNFTTLVDVILNLGDNLTRLTAVVNAIILQNTIAAWTNLAGGGYTSPWIAGSVPVKYTKDGLGRVYLGGNATTSSTSGSIVLTLPLGYRPSTNLVLMVRGDVAGLVDPCYISINTSGVVVLDGYISYTTGNLYFDAISFLSL